MSIDVRILSATHKNIAQLVADGRFREDLYYRINVIELRVPSLRERKEDIPHLADTILTRLARRMRTGAPKLSESALKGLADYRFPGNVRELENVLERALTLCRDGEIDKADLQLRPALATTELTGDETLRLLSGASLNRAPGSTDSNTPALSVLGDQLDGIERDAIQKALEQTRYNKTAAAKVLGITFRALRYRIKKLGIE